jgi:hypothetical protein
MIIISWPIVLPVKVRPPRRGAVARAAVIALAVVDTLAAIVRLLVALVEIVKEKRERERDAKADLRLSRALGCKEQTACCEQNEKRFHGLDCKRGERAPHPIFADWFEA